MLWIGSAWAHDHARRFSGRLLALSAAGALVVGSLPAAAAAASPTAAVAAPAAAAQAVAAPDVPAAAQPQAVASGDWPQFHNDVGHQGNNTAETTISASNVSHLGVAWTGATGGSTYSYSSPVVANGVVYIGSTDGRLYAYAVGCKSGGGACSPLWEAVTGASIVSSPAVDSGVVYVTSRDHKVYAFDAAGSSQCAVSGGVKTCLPLWTATTGGEIWGSPAVAGGMLYVGSYDEKLYAFSLSPFTMLADCTGIAPTRTCKPLWTGATSYPIMTAPAVANGLVYVTLGNGKLNAFSTDGVTGCSGVFPNTTCQVRVAADMGDPLMASPVVAASTGWVTSYVYVVDSIGSLDAYDATGVQECGGPFCSPIWMGFDTINVIEATPAVANGVIYVVSKTTGKLYAYDANASFKNCRPGNPELLDCDPIWTATTGAGIEAAPSVANGVVYVGSDDGRLYAFDAAGSSHCAVSGGKKTCTPLWSHATGAAIYSSPAVSNGVVYVGSDDGKLYAFSQPVAPAPPVGPTPSAYHPVTPVRVLDTRKAIGLSGKLKAGIPRTFQVSGHAGVPAGAVAVTGNATVVNSSAASSIYLGPVAIAKPKTYTMSFNKGQIANRGVTLALSKTGSLSVTYMAASGTTDLVLDISGYFSTASGGDTYHPLTPARLLDTRTGNGLSGKLKANTPRTFKIWGRGGVPKTAKAVTGNVTVVNSTNAWAIYLGPAPVTKPGASTINFLTGQIAGNSLTVALSATGTLSATYMSGSGNTTDLVFDVTGFYTADTSGTRYVPLTPASLLDTRTGVGMSGKFSANSPRTFTVRGHAGVPTTATGITGVVSVTNQTGPWALGVGPTPATKPTTSALNFLKGDVCSNGVTVALSSTGTLSLTYMAGAGNKTDVVLYVTGYFVK